MINPEINQYNENQQNSDRDICRFLAGLIGNELHEAESKIWHSHPVWFLDKNPIVGYSKQKNGIRLMFWSGKSFDDEQLTVKGNKFQDASVFYNDLNEINKEDIIRWLRKSKEIQWDYKNLVKRKGELIRLK